MKVNGVGGPAVPSASRPASKNADGFRLPASGGSGATSAASASSAGAGVAGVSALMALQGIEDPTERRRRAIRRGSTLLDKLDELKLGLLGGETSPVSLQGLARAMSETRDGDEEPGLKAVLDQIDLRAAVEMAKAEGRRKT
ncbi:flagellar assembly protein FliX [Brevundimonas sp.]|uniref:flagellar assembly protein FliX n=1 Tax=Brevundimonas sp. TaxID=1871086 RepID=UPI002FC5F00A